MKLFTRHYNLIQTGLLHGMTDTHTHLMWGIDDGPRTKQQARHTLAALQSVGVQKAFCTPHIMAGLPLNDTARLKKHFAACQQEWSEHTDIRFCLAAEYMLDESFPARLTQPGGLLTYAGRRLLVEISEWSPPADIHEKIFEIRNNGYRPVWAHPERYVRSLPPDTYKQMKEQGDEFQLNLPSLSGRYGEAVRRQALRMLEAGHYDYLGSDIHDPSYGQSIRAVTCNTPQLKQIEKLLRNNQQLEK